MNDSQDPNELDPNADRAIEQSIDYTGESRQESMITGLIAGLIAAILCAVGWAAFTISTGMQFGLIAIAVGMVVGIAVRYGGNGWESKFGVMAAVLAFAGCVVGNYLSIVAMIAQTEEGVGYVEVMLGLGFEGAWVMMVEFFDIMDILFYGIAVSSAYRMGFQE